MSKQSPQQTRVCACICLFLLCLKESPTAISASLTWERRELSSKQLFQHKTVAFPCRWLIQVWWGGRGFGLCPLITLYYHTGGIYHQTPKASVHGEHWNQSHRLHAIHPGPQKAALLNATTSIFPVRGGCSKEKLRGKEQRGKEGFKKTLG